MRLGMRSAALFFVGAVSVLGKSGNENSDCLDPNEDCNVGVKTKSPTGAPTLVPTATPTAAPTLVPTAQPTKQPSSGPTPIPTSGPTLAPTASPTDTPVVPPTESPTFFQASEDPSVCFTEGGVFGEEKEDPLVVPYGFEVELIPDSEESVQSVVSELENSFVDFLLPSLFTDCEPVRRRLQANESVQVVGISSSPPDVIQEGIGCENPLDANAPCDLVLGSMSIFLEGDVGDLEDLQDQVQRLLEEGMDGGSYNDAHPDVARISYVDPDTITDRGLEPEDDSSPDPLLVYSLIAAAGVIVLTCIALAFLGKQEAPVAPGGYDDDDDDDEVEPQKKEDDVEVPKGNEEEKEEE